MRIVNRSRLRLHLMASGFYALLAFIVLHGLILNNGTHTAGYDFFNYNWNFWWMRHALSTPGLNVYANDFVMFPFMGNFGYHALTAVWFPVWALLEPALGTLTVMNIIIFVVCFLNGYMLFVLLRREGAATSLALLGGAALQFSPVCRYWYYNTHINLMDWFWLPAHLLLWGQVARAVEGGRFRAALGWGALQGVLLWGVGHTDLQFPIFVSALLGPYALWTVWRSRKRVALMAVGCVPLVMAGALLWFAGPLPYMARFSGTLAPGDVNNRPGIPFPAGYLTLFPVWWEWNVPTLGGQVSVAVLGALVAGWTARKRVRLPAQRWFWFVVMLPPLVFSMGPNITVLGTSIPMPFRLLHAATNGMFGMPWRLAPIFIIAALVFVCLTFTPLVPRAGLQRGLLLVGVLLLAVLDIRLYESGPMQPAPRQYEFYTVMGRERGAPYDDYVVVEVPTGAGTGETIVGDPRATQLQYYGMIHGKRMVNGFISRAPVEHFWYLRTDDPMLSWLGQRRDLEPDAVEAQLRERVFKWPIGYIVIHRDLIGANSATPQEIIGYLNSLDDLVCPVFIEGAAVVFRSRWHPEGCPARTPAETEPGVYTIDIGSPGDERFIGWGWHWPENIFDMTLRWMGEYPQTQLYVDLLPGDYEITLTAQAFWETRTLRLLVNGQGLGEPAQVGTEGMQVMTYVLPADVVGAGEHLTLTLEYDAVIVPSEVGQSADPRHLALAVDWIQFSRVE